VSESGSIKGQTWWLRWDYLVFDTGVGRKKLTVVKEDVMGVKICTNCEFFFCLQQHSAGAVDNRPVVTL